MSNVFLELEATRSFEPIGKLLAIDGPIDAYVEPFRELLGSDVIRQLTIDTLRRHEELSRRLMATSTNTDWSLLMADRFTLAVRSLPVRAVYTPPSDPFRSDRKFLIALPNDILLGVIGSGRVSVELYRSASPRSSDVFSRQHRLERVGTRQVEPGEVIALRAGHDVVDFWAVDADAVIVELALLKADRIVWNYDAETLQAAFASSASVDATRVEYAIELFQLLRYADAVPNLLHLVREHGHHGVRWKAVKAILHLDLAQGISALRIAVDDPHEHVRNAARATLRNLTEAKLVEEAECHGA